ncbi:MAG: hypothetical protein LQ337_003591 [Flavoplaca oasis]|nr:MAG: hypothetical protein LQ337_003591 [Flavoplaca oasis]
MAPKNQYKSSDGGFHFLNLPRELRDRIYELVLDFEEPPPEAPDEDSERRTIHPKTFSILVPQQLPPPSSGSLLRCNHQVFHELSEAISRCDVTYKLDLVLKGRREDGPHAICGDRVGFYPTWTKLPASPRHLKHVAINIRLCNYVVLYKPGIRIMTVARDLLHFFGCAFTYGPKFVESSTPCEPFFIQEMSVNVEKNYTDELTIWYTTRQKSTFAKLPRYLQRIARQGVLAGKVGAISFYWHGEFRDRWYVDVNGIHKNAASEWARPGWRPRIDPRSYIPQ